MGVFVVIVIGVVGFFALRFVMRAKGMSNAISEVVNTSNKVRMTIDIARQKAGHIVAPGPITPEKQLYIAYLREIASAFSLADNHPVTMCQAFVMQEARDICDLADEEDSKALMEHCSASKWGIEGTRMGKVDGVKLADPKSTQPYFVEFDQWLAQRA